MDLQRTTLVMIPQEELTILLTTQQEILQFLKKVPVSYTSVSTPHVTAKEFMVAVRICRSKFDQLVSGNKIKTIKKRRKIYVPASEIERYFSDPSIQ